jgi:acetyl esterase/lipase
LLPLAVLAALLAAAPARAQEKDKQADKAAVYEVEVVKDVAYADDDLDKHKLDLYLPRGQKDFPVLFFVHGGTWHSGDRSVYPRLGQLFGKQGIGMVIISYRLSPKVQHPAHIQDVAKAFAWTRANVGKYGGKPDEIFACGHSAGGHLVALLATDDSYLKAEKLAVADIKGVIPLSGVYLIPPYVFPTVFGKDKEACKAASPVEHVKDNEPPFLLAYADKDLPTLPGMAELMYDKLKATKCDATLLKMKDRDHISIIKSLDGPDDPLQLAMLDFIAKHSSWKAPARAETKP